MKSALFNRSAKVSFLLRVKLISRLTFTSASKASSSATVEVDIGSTSSIEGRAWGPSIDTVSPPRNKMRSGFGIGSRVEINLISEALCLSEIAFLT